MAENIPPFAGRSASSRRSSDRRKAAAPPRPTKEKASGGLGLQLRHVRERASITVRELARRVGVSPSLISQVERGLATPSVGTLLLIAKEFGLEIGDLFNFRAGTGQTTPGPVQRRSSRKVIRLASGVSWERLTSAPDSEVEFLYAVYNVGSASCEEDSMMRHGGKEYGYLLSGRLGVKIGFEEYELSPGDAISFDAQVPHRLWCVGPRPAVAIWAVVRRRADARQRPNDMASTD
jgi:transcriptional regulator with XRE-family HTH domain